MKETLGILRKDLHSQAEGAENNQVQAEKLFGIDQMSTDQIKVALRKTALVRNLSDVFYLDQRLTPK